MKGKRVAITGGAGFIGANLAEELATGNSVIIIDDLSTGRKI
ncbi:MAG: NAD-dependent epimerase/dehydratase family protein [Dehalococcoidales bacterium]|nr:NAD-dependent epimerase/dehydratase family protein [Dehalococcoidales bacterium]